VRSSQPFWPAWVERHFARHTGPEDEPDERLNGDPSSTLGEDDDTGQFEEMHDWPDPDFDPEDDEDDEYEDDC
jgi:hypothetical protein